jgi:hypothetical protein
MRADRSDIVAVSTRSLHGPRPTGAAPADFSAFTSSSVKSANMDDKKCALGPFRRWENNSMY